MTNRDFHSDTLQVEEHFNNFYNTYQTQRGNTLNWAPKIYHPEWDVKLVNQQNIEYKLELKVDQSYTKYGNICIEYANVNYKTGVVEPSGISLSQSDFYVFIIPTLNDELLMYTWKTSTLRMYVANENPIKEKKIGNGYRSRCYCPSLEWLLKNYKPVKKEKIPHTNSAQWCTK
jgi:hypothetical protein